MVKLSVISQREVGDTLQDFEKRRYLILSALRAQKNLSTAAFFTKRERSSKVSPTSLWRSVHKLFTHAFVLAKSQDKPNTVQMSIRARLAWKAGFRSAAK